MVLRNYGADHVGAATPNSEARAGAHLRRGAEAAIASPDAIASQPCRVVARFQQTSRTLKGAPAGARKNRPSAGADLEHAQGRAGKPRHSEDHRDEIGGENSDQNTILGNVPDRLHRARQPGTTP